jgi:multiple antibiotic resistance protein
MIGSDFGQLTGAILLMVGALLPVVNPLGDAPIFLRLTPGCDELTRADLAKRIAFYSFILLQGRCCLARSSCVCSAFQYPSFRSRVVQ